MTAETGDELERAADQARARLLDTVVRLEQRGRGALEVPKEMARATARFSLPVAGLTAVGILALVMHGIIAPKRPRARDRWRLIKTFWRHPDRELRAERRPFAVEVLRSLLLTLATSALASPLRHAVRALGERADRARTSRPQANSQAAIAVTDSGSCR